jgi:polyisoprenoid-binding protein YceI
MAIETAPTRLADGRLVPGAGTWEVDQGHTIVGFEGRHLMVSRIRGTFRKFSGRIRVAEIPEDSHAELLIDAASVESGFKDRDDHLRSPDFFDVERYPTIRFQSVSIEHVEGARWRARGELTVRDVTRPIDVEIEFEGGTADPWGGQRIGAVISAKINREDFGLTWNQPLAGGGLLVGKEITLVVTVEAVRRSEELGEAGAEQFDAAGVRVGG